MSNGWHLIILIIGRAAQFILALATVRVSTTLLSPEEVGRVSLVTATTTFFALFLVNPIGMFINRRLHDWYASGVARRYLVLYVNYLLLASLVTALCIPILFLSGLVNIGIPIGWLIFLICGSLVFNTINQTTIPSLNLLGDSKRFILLTVTTVGMSFICATLFVEVVQHSAQYWLMGLLLGQAIVGLIGTKVLFARLQGSEILEVPQVRPLKLQSLFSFAWPIVLAAGLGWVQGQGYRYLLESRLGLAQLGLFVAGYGISIGIIAGAESVLTAYFQPQLYREVSTANLVEKGRAWQRYATAVIPAVLLTVIAIIILAPELTRVFLGPKFQAGAAYVAWGALAEAARVLVAAYSLIAHVHMRTRWLILPNCLGAIASVSLCSLFISILGATGAGIGLAISGGIVVMTMHILLAGHVGGGAPTRPIVLAGLSGVPLWGVTVGLRHLVPSGWMSFAAPLSFAGIAYLGLQYCFFRLHLESSSQAAGSSKG